MSTRPDTPGHQEIRVDRVDAFVLSQLTGRVRSSMHVWADALQPVLARYEITTPIRMAHFLGQIAVESGGFRWLTECMSYRTADALIRTWPARFTSISQAMPYMNRPEKLANHVYGGRMGNTETGDGYRFRGRGLIHVTGRSNYTALQKELGATGVDADILQDPGLLSQPHLAAISAGFWWHDNRVSTYATGVGVQAIQRVSRLVNRGDAMSPHAAHHEAQRRQRTMRAYGLLMGGENVRAMALRDLSDGRQT